MGQNKDLLKLMLDRRSCRSYQDQPLPRPTLTAIVQAGRYAPSSMNQQLCHFYIITDPQVLQRITQAVSARLERYADTDCRYGAPALVLVTNSGEGDNALFNTACAMENMMLAAFSLGVGSCWINQLHALNTDPELRAILSSIGVTQGELIGSALSLGIPAPPVVSGRRARTGNGITWVSQP